MQSVVDEYSSQAHAAVDDAQTKLDGLLAQLHGPATLEWSSASASSAVAASKTVVKTAKVARRLAANFGEQIRTAEVEVRALTGKMETLGGSDWQQLDAQRKPVVALLSELLLGAAVLMGVSVEELEIWFDHRLGSSAEVEAGSWTWPQLVTALLAQAPSEAQAPDAAYRALHAAAAGRAAVREFTGRLDSALAATSATLAAAGHPPASAVLKSAQSAHDLAASTRQIAAVLLSEEEGASAGAAEQPVSRAMLAATGRSVREPGTDELVRHVRGLVERYSQDRAAVAGARARLEGLHSENRSADGLGVADRTAEVEAAGAIVEAARGAWSLASEMTEQIRAARLELRDISEQLDVASSKEQELALEARLQPAKVFLEELLSGTAVLLNSSLVELQGFYVRTLASSQHSELVGQRGASSWEWPAFASSGLLLVDIAPDSTRKALDVARAALVMLRAFMKELDAALAETSGLLGRLPATSGSARVALDQELVASALYVARVLEVNFVVEEAARSTAGVLARTDLPVLIAMAVVFVGKQT